MTTEIKAKIAEAKKELDKHVVPELLKNESMELAWRNALGIARDTAETIVPHKTEELITLYEHHKADLREMSPEANFHLDVRGETVINDAEVFVALMANTTSELLSHMQRQLA